MPLTDRRCLPLNIALASIKVQDGILFAELLDEVVPLKVHFPRTFVK
jgi:hypothetical protein